MAEENIVDELDLFKHELALFSHSAYRFVRRENLTQKEKEDGARVHEILSKKVGYLRFLISDLSGVSTVESGGKDYDMWLLSLRTPIDNVSYSALGVCEQATTRAIGKLEHDIKDGIRDKKTGLLVAQRSKIATELPKAFIAHGGESPALNKLKKFLEALGVKPLVVEEQASEDRSIGDNVDWYSKKADCAIILATKGDVDGKTGEFLPRGNVLMEIGKLQTLFKGRIVYLLQSNTKYPTNVSEKVWAHFSPQSMDNAFIKISRELSAFGILNAVKPPSKESKT